MIDCLIDFVGLIYCDGDASVSGQYVNSLPGMRVERIDMIADDEQITYLGVWVDVQEAASARFYSDVIEKLSECYQLNPYCDYEDLICQNKLKLVNAWKYLLGNQLMLENIYSNRINRYTVSKEDAKELLNLYQIEYEKSLAQAVKQMNVESCELCCSGGNPEKVSWLP